MRLIEAVIAISAALLLACTQPVQSSEEEPREPPPRLTLSDDEIRDRVIRDLEARVRRDELDHVAWNKLAGYYLQLLRERNQPEYLELAMSAATSSLEAAPAEYFNLSGLAALAQAKLAGHDFAGARADARRLLELNPGLSLGYRLLGDAELELGNYDEAIESYEAMKRLSGGVETETRLARIAWLQGRVEDASQHFKNAFAHARALPLPPPQVMAWCQWQLGELAFAQGNYAEAERLYRDALAISPRHVPARIGMGKARAAQGDTDAAIAHYRQVADRWPDPSILGTLGDLYLLSGREREAREEYALAEATASLPSLTIGGPNRSLALFRANHELNVEQAYEAARQDSQMRADIYTSDTLAWAAFKANRLDEARTAMRQALRLGTQDPLLFYHAGMIALAAGNDAQGRSYLRRALELSPHFDPLQSRKAREALAQ